MFSDSVFLTWLRKALRNRAENGIMCMVLICLSNAVICFMFLIGLCFEIRYVERRLKMSRNATEGERTFFNNRLLIVFGCTYKAMACLDKTSFASVYYSLFTNMELSNNLRKGYRFLMTPS